MMMLMVTMVVCSFRNVKEPRPKRPTYDFSAYCNFWATSYLSRDSQLQELKKEVNNHTRPKRHRTCLAILEILMNVMPFVWTLVHILYLKFGHLPDCDLSNVEEDQWTIGQLLAMVMLVGFMFPGFDAWAGKLVCSGV
jgi:hypothetical protein